MSIILANNTRLERSESIVLYICDQSEKILRLTTETLRYVKVVGKKLMIISTHIGRDLVTYKMGAVIDLVDTLGGVTLKVRHWSFRDNSSCRENLL